MVPRFMNSKEYRRRGGSGKENKYRRTEDFICGYMTPLIGSPSARKSSLLRIEKLSVYTRVPTRAKCFLTNAIHPRPRTIPPRHEKSRFQAMPRNLTTSWFSSPPRIRPFSVDTLYVSGTTTKKSKKKKKGTRENNKRRITM